MFMGVNMNNLEPDCLAIITFSHKGKNIGKIVKVIKFVGEMDGPFYGLHLDWWQIEPTPQLIILEQYVGKDIAHPGKYMRKISPPLNKLIPDPIENDIEEKV
jgi:hypothetical protein